jgi:hypothetical protein
VAVDRLPVQVAEFLKAAGVDWPYVSERALRGFLELLRVYRREMLETHYEATDSLAVVAREQPMEAALETLADWAEHAEAYVFGVTDEVEVFATFFERWTAELALRKSAVVDQLSGLAGEFFEAKSDETLRAAHAGAAKDLIGRLESVLEADVREAFEHRLQSLLAKVAESDLLKCESSLARGEGGLVRGADVDLVLFHADKLKRNGDTVREIGDRLTKGIAELDFGARPGEEDDVEPGTPDPPSYSYAIWRGRTYTAEPAGDRTVCLAIPMGDARPPVTPELGSWPYTGNLYVWPAELDGWFDAAKPDEAARTDLLEFWRLEASENAFRYFTQSNTEFLPPESSCIPDTAFTPGEFAVWRGRLYGAQTMDPGTVRLFALPGDVRTPVVPDLARHAKGMWASPIELDEWYALWTTFYVGDAAYMALGIESGVIEGFRAFASQPVRRRFALSEILDLQEERRDLLADYR